MSTLAMAKAISVPTVGIRVLSQLAGVFILGIIILYGAGFANMGAVHGAAHDARHAHGFPCH